MSLILEEKKRARLGLNDQEGFSTGMEAKNVDSERDEAMSIHANSHGSSIENPLNSGAMPKPGFSTARGAGGVFDLV